MQTYLFNGCKLKQWASVDLVTDMVLKAIDLDYSQCRGLKRLEFKNNTITATVIIKEVKEEPCFSEFTRYKHITQEMRFGKYLRKVDPTDSANTQTFDAQIQQLVTSAQVILNGDLELKYAATSEDIIEVYRRGSFYSCMSDREEVGVYAKSCSVAYVEYNGDLIGRSIVRRDSGEYMQCYGNVHLMEKLLQKAGHSKATCGLNGVKLDKIEYDVNSYQCPYLDCRTLVSICDDYLLVHEDGELATTENGYIGNVLCVACNRYASADEFVWVYDDKQVCQSCIDEDYVYISGHCYGYFLEDECVEVNDEWYLKTSDEIVQLHDGEWEHIDSEVVCTYDEGECYRLEETYYDEELQDYRLLKYQPVHLREEEH